MAGKRKSNSFGFTIVELMISMVVMIIASFAIGAVIVDGQNSWTSMYNKIHSDIVTDGFVAVKRFDSVIRKASNEKIFIRDNNSSVEVYYFSSDTATSVDRYMRFYQAGNNLNLEYGDLDSKSAIDIETICENVSSCTFNNTGQAIQMILVLDNGTKKNTIITSAVAHN